MKKQLDGTADATSASLLERRSLIAHAGAGLLLAGAGAVLASRIATAAEPGESVALGRHWIDALNRRDVPGLSAILSDDFLYSAMLKNPPEMMARWSKDKFLGITKSTADAGWKKPVIMTIKSEFGAGDRAVIETEGYSELADGYVYANVYCFNFWTAGGKIKAIHDYCCTHTAWLLGQHIRETAKAKAS
jgi:ketosteroid isomerase-like protein